MNPIRWLGELAVLCASGNISLADTRLKMEAYSKHLPRDFAPWAFSDTSLRHVASSCKFFPTYGELCEHLREWCINNAPHAATPRLEGPASEATAPQPYEPTYHGYARARANEPRRPVQAPAVGPAPRPIAIHLRPAMLAQSYAAQGVSRTVNSGAHDAAAPSTPARRDQETTSA